MAKITLASVKKLGWDAFVVNKAGFFKGAVSTYESNSGKQVAVGFNLGEAFVLADEQGTYTASELEGNMKGGDIDFNNTSVIEGCELLAWATTDEDGELDGEVEFDEQALEKYGILDFSVKEQIKARVLDLAKLNQ